VMFAKWSQMPAPRSHSHARPCWPVRSDRAVHQFGAESPPPAGPRVGIGGHGPARLGAMPRSVIRRAPAWTLCLLQGCQGQHSQLPPSTVLAHRCVLVMLGMDALSRLRGWLLPG
jgi:hypothetical protein